MVQGPAVAGTLIIDVSPLQLTNAVAADISVTATGLTVGATTIDTNNNLVKIPVMAGGSASGSNSSGRPPRRGCRNGHQLFQREIILAGLAKHLYQRTDSTCH